MGAGASNISSNVGRMAGQQAGRAGKGGSPAPQQRAPSGKGGMPPQMQQPRPMEYSRSQYPQMPQRPYLGGKGGMQQPRPMPYQMPQRQFGGKGGYDPRQMQMQQPNPVANNPAPGMSIDEFSRSSLMGPTTQEVRPLIEFEGSMRDPELVRRYEQYRSGGSQQDFATMLAEAQQAQQSSLDSMYQARRAGLQFGPTPNQPPNPYASMSVPQRQAMIQSMNQQNAMRSSKGGFQPQPQMMGGLASLLGRRMY